jgi:hypothetical protein
MRFVGRYLDELTDAEREGLLIVRMDDRLKDFSRELIVRERCVDGVIEITVSRVLTAPID